MEIPKEVKNILSILEKNKYQAYIVGGCVRDVLRGAAPKDWDVATNATPEEIQATFKKAGFKSFYENQFGTVTVLTKSKTEALKEIEITPFRTDEKYTDKRHPDKISWAKTIEQDLARRDFTINAIAGSIRSDRYRLNQGKNTSKYKAGSGTKQSFEVIDPFKGQKDLENKVIRAVGKPEKRFSEDALRLMRAVRFAVSLEPDKIWQIEEKTEKALKKNAHLLDFISEERIRDELMKIIMCHQAAKGIEILRRLGLLKYIIPELEQGFGIWQNKHHIYQVYQHGILSLNYACKHNFSKHVRLASLLHDIGKPKTKKGEGLDSTFYNHEVVGAKMTCQILERLKFSKKDIEKIAKLVRYHLFYYNVGEVGESSVRRLLRKVGQEDIEELLQVRQADRIGSGVPKAEPYKLRHLKYLFEKVSRDPISSTMLKIDGNDIMKMLDIKPSPKVGQILSYLLSQVLSDPKKNVRALLEKETARLGKLSDQELEKLAQKAKKEIETIETKQDQMTKNKYWVT